MSHFISAAMPPTVSSVEDLEVLLREAEESGEPLEMSPAEWQRLRDDVENDALHQRKAS